MSPNPDSTQRRSDQLATLLSGTAPTPTSSRFKPLRMGLLGIWEYGNEEFHFHDGRLILRGRNGSGKTKVLEVTSPFLFDANLSARRLDPFGNNARSMRENLLYDGRTHQIGYVWCEYGRIVEGGGAEYRTIGAGMRARETKSGAPESWYFMTPLRVDVDFNLYDNAERPLDDSDLAKRLGGADDTVFTTAEHYRAKLARELFGLSPQRLHSLVELLIILRRPKLSENLSVDRLKEILSNGLPPIDDELVAGLAKNFDDLKRDEEDLKRFIKAQEEVDLFLRSYRVYARRMTRHITNDVLDAKEKHRKALNRGKRAALDLEKTDTAIAEAETDLLHLEDEQGELRGRIRALEGGPEMRNQNLLARLHSDVERAVREAASAKQRTGKAANQLVIAKSELGEAADKLAKTRKVVAEAKAEARTYASSAGLRNEFESEADRLRIDTDTAQNTLQGYITARRAAVKETRRLHGEQQQAQFKVDRVQAAHDDLTARWTTAVEQVQSRCARSAPARRAGRSACRYRCASGCCTAPPAYRRPWWSPCSAAPGRGGWPVVVRSHRQHGVSAQLDGPLGHRARLRRVVRPGRGDHARPRRPLGTGQLDQPKILGAGERGGLPGGRGHHHPVRPGREHMVHKRHERLLVDLEILVERSHDRRQHRPQRRPAHSSHPDRLPSTSLRGTGSPTHLNKVNRISSPNAARRSIRPAGGSRTASTVVAGRPTKSGSSPGSTPTRHQVEMSQLVPQAARDGRMVVIDDTGRLVPSDNDFRPR